MSALSGYPDNADYPGRTVIPGAMVQGQVGVLNVPDHAA
jgi:hypothetical protein